MIKIIDTTADTVEKLIEIPLKFAPSDNVIIGLGNSLAPYRQYIIGTHEN